jgi:hypothetical protein
VSRLILLPFEPLGGNPLQKSAEHRSASQRLQVFLRFLVSVYASRVKPLKPQ